jgi:hypothetical protein
MSCDFAELVPGEKTPKRFWMRALELIKNKRVRKI